MGGKVPVGYNKSYREKNREQILLQRKEYRKSKEYKDWLDRTRVQRTASVSKRQKERKESSVLEWMKHILKSCKSRSKSSVVKTCEITVNDLMAQYEKQNGLCGICGLPMEWKQESLMSISVDRIDNSLGYTVDNIHLVGKWLNIGRGTAPLSEIKLIMERLKISG